MFPFSNSFPKTFLFSSTTPNVLSQSLKSMMAPPPKLRKFQFPNQSHVNFDPVNHFLVHKLFGSLECLWSWPFTLKRYCLGWWGLIINHRLKSIQFEKFFLVNIVPLIFVLCHPLTPFVSINYILVKDFGHQQKVVTKFQIFLLDRSLKNHAPFHEKIMVGHLVICMEGWVDCP